MNMLRDMLQPTRRNMLRSMFTSTTSTTALTRFAVNGVEAALALDFIGSEYRTGNAETTFADAFTGTSPKLTYSTAAGSNSTMVNSSGEIVWAPHNLLDYSEDFSQSSWTLSFMEPFGSGSTVNATTGPDGQTAADFIRPTTNSTNQHYVRSNYSGATVGAMYTISVYAKAGGYSSLSLRALGTNAPIVKYDLATGTADDPDGTIQAVGNGWFRCSLTGEATQSLVYHYIYPNQTSAYAGDGTSGIYLWGAHVYRSDLGGMAPVPGADTGFETYVPTNGNEVHLPRVGHHVYNGSAWVNEGLLIESEPRTNLVYPSQFPTSAVGLWAAPNGATAVVDQTGPDGLTSATTLTASSTGNSLRCRITTTQSGSTTYTLSFYAKAGSSAYVYARNIAVSGVAAVDGVWWDVSDFSVAVQGSGVAVAGSQPVGNGWYRCYMTATTASSPANNLVDIGIADTAGTVSTTSGDTGIFYGAQLEQGATPSSYIPTSGSTVIRGGQSLTVPANWYDVDNPTPTGPELVDEASDLYATYYPNAWTIGVGSASSDGTQAGLDRLQIKPNGSFLPVGVYVLSFDVTSGSSVYGVYSNSAGGYITSALSVGSYSVVVNQSSLSELKFVISAAAVVSIDNISVRQVSAPQFGWPEPEYIGPNLVDNHDFSLGDNGDWVAQADWSITGGVASKTTGTQNSLYQDLTGVSPDSLYEITFDVSNKSGGGVVVFFTGSNVTTVSGNGLYTFIVKASATNSRISFQGQANTTVTIDNISVREINPLSVSIQMDGRMTYADEDTGAQATPFNWNTGTEWIRVLLSTAGTNTGAIDANQREGGATKRPGDVLDTYSPGVNVPFNIASRHGSTFINGAVDGVTFTADTTPTALPDLSNTNLQIAHDFMGTIGQFRQFAGDVGDTGIVTATNPSTEPTLSLTFDGTASGSFYNLSWSE